MATTGDSETRPRRWRVEMTDRYTDETYVVERDAASEEEVRNALRPWYGQRVDAIEAVEEGAH